MVKNTSSKSSQIAAKLPAATALGPVELTVTDLDRAIGFYTQAIGLEVQGRVGSIASLGASGRNVLILHEDRAAKPPGRHAGIFHVALLFPSRAALAGAAQRIIVNRLPIQGAADHGTHEAIYLPDADGIGLELAWDRPRDQWPDVRDPSAYAAGPEPLDLQGLLDLVKDRDLGAPAEEGLKVGHVHLHVGDIEAARRFYSDVVGFEEQVFIGTAAFVSAGGYHHHVAFNNWRGSAIPHVPDGVVGMRHFTVELPRAQDVVDARVRMSSAGVVVADRQDGFAAQDPSGNAILLKAGGSL